MRTITLNIIKGYGLTPMLNVSQFDKGYTVACTVQKGAEAFTPPAGSTATVEGRKPDGTGYQYPATIDGSTVTFTVMEQMTVLSGRSMAEIVFYDADAVRIGTANFYLLVEEAPLNDNTVISETALPAIIDAANANAERAEDAADEAEATLANFAEVVAEQVEQMQIHEGQTVIDGTLTVSGAAADAKVTGDELNGVKSATSAATAVTGKQLVIWEHGNIVSGTGEDSDTNKDKRIRTKGFLNIPATLTLGNGVKVIIIYYDTDKTFVLGTSWYTTPGDYPLFAVKAAYARIVGGYSNDAVITNVSDVSALISISDYSLSVANDVVKSQLKTLDSYPYSYGWVSNSNVWSNLTDKWLHAVIPVNSGDIIDTRNGSKSGFVAFVTDYVDPVNNASPLFSAESGYTGKITTNGNASYHFVVPSDAKYMLISLTFDAAVNDYKYVKINGYDIIKTARDNISLAMNGEPNHTTWYALGDSITQGFTSKNGAISSVVSENYVYYVAKYNGYNAVNYGVGGSGYNHAGTVLDKLNARDHVDTIDFSGCDLVTLAYGVNDWHYNVEIGAATDDPATGGTMASNMRYCIEKILADNPLCKIVVILPMNNSAFGEGNTKENNWGLGASFSVSGTLQHVIDVEKAICEYYGIAYIDQSKTSVVNRQNIQTLLSDGTHPIAEAYSAIGATLAKQIQFA